MSSMGVPRTRSYLFALAILAMSIAWLGSSNSLASAGDASTSIERPDQKGPGLGRPDPLQRKCDQLEGVVQSLRKAVGKAKMKKRQAKGKMAKKKANRKLNAAKKNLAAAKESFEARCSDLR